MTNSVHPITASILAAITPQAEFSDDDRAQAARLLDACIAAVAVPFYQTDHGEIERQLHSLTNGYGCWLEYVEEAIRGAALDEPDRAAILGAFGMAQAWIFAVRDRTGHLSSSDPQIF